MVDNNKSNAPNLTIADIIRKTAISWATGAFTEKQIRYCLKHDYKLSSQDIDSVLIGCNELQKGMFDALVLLGKNNKKDITEKEIN